MAIELDGRTIDTDEEGFLKDLNDWSEEVANKLAQSENITMSETHWGLVEVAREFFEEHQKHPSTHDLIHLLGRYLKKSVKEERHDLDTYLYKLFPYGPEKQLAKIAGLPKPLPSSTEG